MDDNNPTLTLGVIQGLKPATYTVKIMCSNCGHGFDAHVPKGTLVAAYCWRCPKCDCTRDQVDTWAGQAQGLTYRR